MLTKIKHYVEQRGSVSLEDIALHFDTQVSAMQGMLAVWVRKGELNVSDAPAASCKSNCGQCSSAATAIYSSTRAVIKFDLS